MADKIPENNQLPITPPETQPLVQDFVDQLSNIPPETQQFFQDIAEYVIPILKEGRLFDLKHTFATAYWAYQICIQENLDPEILVTAALFHDTGYMGLFDESNNSSTNFDNIQDKKALHMERSETIAREFIPTNNHGSKLPKGKITKILYIIRHHDEIRNPELIKSDLYLNALVTSDTLGQIDMERVDSFFNREELAKFIRLELLKIREPLITTEFGEKTFIELFGKLYEYYVTI